MKRAALYIRVSTDEQARHGLSLDTQHESLRSYAKSHDYFVVGEYRDEGISARKPFRKRPALLRLLELVEADGVDTILFIKLDRWFRNVGNYYEVQRILDNHNVAWKATQEDYDTETAAGRLKLNILLSVAQDEADRTSERIKFIFEGKRARGEVCSGRVPPGLMIVNKRTAIDEEQAPIVREMFRVYLNEQNLRRTSRWLLNTYGIAPAENTVKLWLRNTRYRDTGLISAEDFDRVQEILKRRGQRNAVTSQNIYLFSGLTRCRECGKVMKCVPPKEGVKRAAYRCSTHTHMPELCKHKRVTRECVIEAWLLENIISEAEKHNAEIIAEQARSGSSGSDQATIKRKMEKLRDLYLNDLIDRDVYESEYNALKNEQKRPDFASQALIDIEPLRNLNASYVALSAENKRAFWHRILDAIYIDQSGDFFITLHVP